MYILALLGFEFVCSIISNTNKTCDQNKTLACLITTETCKKQGLSVLLLQCTYISLGIKVKTSRGSRLVRYLCSLSDHYMLKMKRSFCQTNTLQTNRTNRTYCMHILCGSYRRFISLET